MGPHRNKLFAFFSARTFLLVALAACSQVQAPLVSNSIPVSAREGFDVPLVPQRWALSASAKLENETISFRYCCTNWGQAQTSIAMPAGTWWIGITHTSECDKAMGALVFAPNVERPIAFGGVWGPKVGILQVEIPSELANAPLQLHLSAQGGLSCCGGTTVSKIEIVPL